MKDKFVNKAFASVTQADINTTAFTEIQTGMAMFEKVAWVIHRILWFPAGATIQEITADTDTLSMALVGNNKMTGLSLDDQAVYDLLHMFGWVSGTPANQLMGITPYIRDFSNLPGGGLIVPPRPIYVAIESGGFAAVATVGARIEFTYLELKAEEFWELVEATRIIE